MENKFIVSSSPHIRSNEDTSYIMKQVIFALVPAALAGLWYFRASALYAVSYTHLTALTEDIKGIDVKEVNLDGKYALVDMADGVNEDELKALIADLGFELKAIQ